MIPIKEKVQIWIYFDDPVRCQRFFLLLKMTQERGGVFQPVTGGVEKGESLEAAAQRELREETGFIGSQVSPISYQFEFEKYGVHWRESGFSFPVRLETVQMGPGGLPKVQIDPREHTEYRWVTAEEALQLVGYASNGLMLRSFLDSSKK